MQGTEIQELVKDYEVIANRLRDAIMFGDKEDEASLREAANDCREKAEKLGYLLRTEVIGDRLVASSRLHINKILQLVDEARFPSTQLAPATTE